MTKNTVEYNRAYYLKNKEKRKIEGAVKKHCDCCNCEVRIDHFKRHLKTQKHKRNLEKSQNQSNEV